MKKSDLRSTLGRIRPSDELILKTLDKMEIEKQKKVPRFEVRQSNFSFAYRLAGAMCALILIIGAGVYFGRDTVVSPVADSPSAYSRTAFNADSTAQDSTTAALSSNAENAAEALIGRAEGSWDVLEGEVVAVKCSPENTVVFRIAKHHASSSGYTTESGFEADADGVSITAPNNDIMQALTDSMGSTVCITVNTDGDIAFITDYAICN